MPKRAAKTKDRFGLPMRIGIQGVGLQGGVVLEQAIENVDRFPHAAGDEVAEQGDIRITDMVVRDASETAIPHMMRAQQIVLDECDVGAIGNGAPAHCPTERAAQTACTPQSHRAGRPPAWGP